MAISLQPTVTIVHQSVPSVSLSRTALLERVPPLFPRSTSLHSRKMPVRGLDVWLAERGLVKECPLQALAGTRLGIDAHHYLRKLLSLREPLDKHDAFTAAIGGLPLTLATEIEGNMHTLQSLGIKPVIVFNGINPLDRERPSPNDERSWRRGQAWEHYEHGRLPQAQTEFGSSSSISPQDVFRLVLRQFKQRTTEFVVAPYLAWAQLAYLERHERAYVHSIYGANELFMFDGLDRIILDIDFDRQTISFASKAALLDSMSLTSDQFLDLCVLAGFDGSPTFPAIDPQGFHLRSVVEAIKQRGSGVNAVLAHQNFGPVYQSNYADTFARSRAMIKFSLVLVAHEGRVLPLPLVTPPPAPIGPNSHQHQPPQIYTSADVPVDLGEIFSSHFPEEVYYQVFRGLVAPHVISPLATGQVIEQTPLCGSTPEYERYIKSLNELPQSPRCVSLALVSNVLNPLWSKKPVSAVHYFQPGAETVIPHAAPHTQAFIESVSKWNVGARHIEDELRRQASSTIDLCLCLGGTSTTSLAQRTIVPKNADRPLDKKDEIVANTLWRFLELRSFLTSAHQHTPHAAALHLAMKNSKVNDKFQEPLFLAMELLRANVLHNGRIGTRPYSGGPNLGGTEADKRSMLLVMRVLSIVPLAFTPGAWNGPLSRELLVFNSLPFQTDTNTGMGILFKAYGDAFTSMAGGLEMVQRSLVKDEEVLGLLQGAFTNVKSVRAELERGFRFWNLIMLAVRSLRQSTAGPAIAPDLADQFEAADVWLKPFVLQ
ncbi:Temperature dependent protein affecting M2 dsRNA replication-domain containing protein [Rhodotorula toruloides]|uniref:Temperature dependent protein affecting M2 dsRNA replication-domain containing protein n=1 Tax=Rhodotorula toruloides TaxID=5286 RepID=A0A2T0AG89_RHOTO|nr:Temperature dependent protein affecting M2 dsRNA replication-domain containing protein [Rhodotorula toruloides]